MQSFLPFHTRVRYPRTDGCHRTPEASAKAGKTVRKQPEDLAEQMLEEDAAIQGEWEVPTELTVRLLNDEATPQPPQPDMWARRAGCDQAKR